MGNYTKRYSETEKEQIFHAMFDMVCDTDMSIRQLSKKIKVSKSYIHKLLHTDDFISYVRAETGIGHEDVENTIDRIMKYKKHKGQLKGGKSTAELWKRRKEIR